MTELSQFSSMARDHFDWRIMKVYRHILGAKYIVDDFRGPFVPHVFDEYWNSKRKILIVFQQTTGLSGLQDAVNRRLLFDQLTSITKKRLTGEKFIGTQQLNFALKINSALNRNSYKSIAWTFLTKVTNIHGISSNMVFFDHIILPLMPLLYYEIMMLQPDIIIFLTDSELDEMIKLSVPVDMKLHFRKSNQHDLRDIACFDISGIPCFRISDASLYEFCFDEIIGAIS